MACRIFRDANNNITRVEDKQGNTSSLYSDALALTQNQTEALRIWGVGNSEEYSEINGNTEEPSLSDTLVFMQRDNNKDKKLTKQNIDQIRNNTISIPFSFTEELFKQVQFLYPNGVFTINRSTLRATEFYTESEINTILSDSEIQENIKQTTDSLIAEVSLNETDINTQLALYETSELAKVFDTSQVIGLGKYLQINPFLIDRELREKLGGIKNLEIFEQTLSTVNEAISERYFSDPIYAKRLFDSYSSMDKMLLLEDSDEGLSPVTQSNIRFFTEQALVVGQDTQELNDILDLLVSTPKAVWEDSGAEIEDMLLRVEDYATNIGVDVIGLSEQEYTYEEIIPFLQSLLNLSQKAEINLVEQVDLDTFYDNYNILFFANTQPLFTAREINATNKGRSLAVVDSIKTEQELFDQNNLVKVNNENVYQRVNRQQNIEQLYDYLTDLVQFNPNVIDKKALTSAYTTSGNFSYRNALNTANREAIREDIIRYVQQQPFSEELTIYKIAFGHPLIFPVQEKVMQNEYTRVNKNINETYLTTDFIADFAKEYLEEKQKDSEIFKKVYNHFSFNSKGITLKDNDSYSKQEINLFNTNENLVKYAAISKDTEMNNLFTVEEVENLIPNGFIRKYYINNPEQLTHKTVEYQSSEDGEYISVQNIQDDFINIGGEVYEKTQNYKNLSIYQKLPVNTDPYFYNYNIDFTPNENPDVEQFKDFAQQAEQYTTVEKVYTKKELESINQRKECN